MQSTGSQYHRSNLLSNLAYMGSPAAALRNEATASGMHSSALFSRDVRPLAVDTVETTNVSTGQPVDQATWAATFGGDEQQSNGATSALGTVDLNSNSEQPTRHDLPTVVDTHVTQVTHTVVPVNPTDETNVPPPPTGPEAQTAHPPAGAIDQNLSAKVHGDPHWNLAGTEWTQKGVAGETYLVASGNGVFVSALYVLNGYNYCVMGAVQVTIPADPAHGIPNELVLEYGITNPNKLTIKDGDSTKTVNFNSADANMRVGDVEIASKGQKLTITTKTDSGHTGVFALDIGWGRGLAVNVQGDFDDANGVVNYLNTKGENGKANIYQDKATLESVVDKNFNLNYLSSQNPEASKYVMDYKKWWNPNKKVGW